VDECFDVVVVGARCAGSPLAALLARRGLRVAVVEQATFPRDTLSTHYFEAGALAFLNRLGVIEQVRATGAPFVGRNDVRIDDLEYVARVPQRPGDVGGGASVRRTLLDPILAEAAAEAGADLHMGSKVTGLVRDRGRVAGVRIRRDGSEATLKARLVVGADGRNSTIGRLVGARKYNVTPNQRFTYWSFFEGAEPGPDPAFILHRWAERFVLAAPTDSGLYEVVVIPDLRELPRFKDDLEGSFTEYACSCRPVAQVLSNARQIAKLLGMLRWEGFFREASGPGWVLAGDAGIFKDFSAGQGIQDAFLQVDALAPAIAAGLEEPPERLDRELAAWGRWRDRDAAEHYWLATDMGKAGRTPAIQCEIVKRILARGKIDTATDLFNHRSRPSQVLTPQRLLGATGRLLARPGSNRREILGEVAALVAENLQRRRLDRWPRYAATGKSLDAGTTEVDDTPAIAV
jgi:2-polyprenyl-6-methoxyphenol hydroxylase-like FAD-dependent oxidoreductase